MRRRRNWRGVQVNVKVLQRVARLWSTRVRDRLDATFAPIIDGTLKGPDALVALLLRAWYKAGRWNTLENIALAPTPDCIA